MQEQFPVQAGIQRNIRRFSGCPPVTGHPPARNDGTNPLFPGKTPAEAGSFAPPYTLLSNCMQNDLADRYPATATERDVYTVSRLNSEVRALLEGSFPLLWVEGEISNLARPSSGHLYFSLKDPNAQVRCAMFKGANRALGFTPANGMQVLARARVGLYEGRGEYQLIVEGMEESGEGALHRAFEQLKNRLAAEGLFAPEHKQAMPALPRQIGVITSPTGAALRDILHVLERRFAAIPVIIYPVPVQGKSAAGDIARMIRLASQRKECDVLILARGGGSLEDLWSFNEEIVARAIYNCAIPIVTGIGHEIDFTIADFVADQRAPTPSAAAELVSPDGAEWLQKIKRLDARLLTLTRNRLRQQIQTLKWLNGRLVQQHPGRRLQQQGQRLDELEQRLTRAQRSLLRDRLATLAELRARLRQYSPSHRVARSEAHRYQLMQRLRAAMRLKLERQRTQLESLMRALDTVSPLATLRRGYAIVTDYPDGGVVRRAADVQVGEQVQAKLGEGRLICEVRETHKD